MFTPSVLHSDIFYLTLIRALIRGLNDGLTDRQIAASLNEAGILAPSGIPYTPNAVTQTLKKLRNHKEYPSKIHKVLLQLVFDGLLAAPATYILFKPRKQVTM
jgi:hypothetical protein